MLNLIPNADVHDPRWAKLIYTSHQTSLFVLPEWLDHFADQLAIAVVEDSAGRWRAGVVAQRTAAPIPFFAYAGLLLTRREDPAAVSLLLGWLEEAHPGACVVNAPSLIDIRPFAWRAVKSGAIWTDRILYTMYTGKTTRPFPDMPPPESTCPPLLPGLEDILDFDSVSLVSGVVWGVDLQNRGYAIAASPGAEGVVWSLAQQHPTADLFGANSPAMNRRKRVYGGQLRTYYRMQHHVRLEN